MIIDLKDVHFNYANSPENTVINIKQWSVPEHEHTFIYGPSGSGKSTFLNIISGLLSGYSGEVSVLGQALNKLSNRQRDSFRSKNIGYVFQQFNLIPYLSAIDNIKLANQFSTYRNNHQLLENIKHLLFSLNIDSAHWKKPTSSLSMGQQQRVAIARVLINKPELLIADEPTSSLDEVNRDRFMSILMTLIAENNTTLLFVSHDKSLSSHFQRIESMPDINQLTGAS